MRRPARWLRLKEYEEAFGFYKDFPLSSGQKLRIEVISYHYENEDKVYEYERDFDVSMHVYSGRKYDIAEAVRNEGQRIGPGGTEVYGHAVRAMREIEAEIARRYPDFLQFAIWVSPVNDKLARIYARTLKSHGYVWIRNDDPNSSLVKRLDRTPIHR